MGASRGLQGGFGLQGSFKGGFKGASRGLQGGFKGASRGLQGFKGASRLEGGTKELEGGLKRG